MKKEHKWIGFSNWQTGTPAKRPVIQKFFHPGCFALVLFIASFFFDEPLCLKIVSLGQTISDQII